MTSPTKGLVERLEEAADSGFYNYKSSQRPYTQSDAQRDEEAATAIRELTQVVRNLLHAKHPYRQIPIQQGHYLLDKYQPEDK